MTIAFTSDGDEIVTVHLDGRVRRSPVPASMKRETFRDVLAAVDVLYRREGRFPSVDEVYKSWPKITKATYSKAFATPEFKEALELRGIFVEAHAGLTPEQGLAILHLSNPDGRTIQSKLKPLGISMAKFQAWMRQPLFAETYRQRSEQTLGDYIPVALNNLAANADKGDQRAIEKLLEISNRYNPAQIEVANARQIVLIMVEAVLKHVTDKDEKTAILSEIEGAMQKMSIVSSLKQIEE